MEAGAGQDAPEGPKAATPPLRVLLPAMGPDSTTLPPGEVEENRAFRSLPGQRERGQGGRELTKGEAVTAPPAGGRPAVQERMMFYDGWKRASARLGRPSHPSALLPSWTGDCRALRGSGKEWAHKTHLDSLAYPPSCYVAKLGPRVGSSQLMVTQLADCKIPTSLPPACLFFLVPWRDPNAQTCRAWGG